MCTFAVNCFNHLYCNGSQSSVNQTKIELIVPHLLFGGFTQRTHRPPMSVNSASAVVRPSRPHSTDALWSGDVILKKHCTTNWFMITSKLAPSGHYQTESGKVQRFDKLPCSSIFSSGRKENQTLEY